MNEYRPAIGEGRVKRAVVDHTAVAGGGVGGIKDVRGSAAADVDQIAAGVAVQRYIQRRRVGVDEEILGCSSIDGQCFGSIDRDEWRGAPCHLADIAECK